jgi:hypothetical protein
MSKHPTISQRALAMRLSEQLLEIQQTIEKGLTGFIDPKDLEGIRDDLEALSYTPEPEMHWMAIALHQAVKSRDQQKVKEAAEWADRFFLDYFDGNLEAQPGAPPPQD